MNVRKYSLGKPSDKSPIIVPQVGAGSFSGSGIPRTGAGHRYQPQAEAFKRPKAISGSSTVTATGSFCSTRVDGSDTYITGGVVRVSNTESFTVADFLILGSSDGNVYVEVNVEPKLTDDDDYFMDGIANCTDTTLVMALDVGTDWPAGTDPDITDAPPTGKIILEIGRVTFSGSDPSFAPTGCGTFHLTHCNGELGYLPR